MPKQVVECDNCGDELLRWPSHINDHNFCDRSCSDEWQTGRRTGTDHPNYNSAFVECAWCGNQLERIQYRIEKYEHQFCNKDCKGKFYQENPAELHQKERTEVECTTCGETLYRIQNRIERSDDHFCSRACKGKWWSEQSSGEDHPLWEGGWEWYYGEDWQEQREKARKRDRYRCFLCGVLDGASIMIHGKELAVHHVVSKSEFDDLEVANQIGNLLTVCAFCHQRVFEG